MKKSQSGNTTVGVAAAAKLYFTVVPANLVQGVYYKVISLWQIYSPWTMIAALVLGAVVLISIFKKYFNLQINLKKKTEHEHKNE